MSREAWLCDIAKGKKLPSLTYAIIDCHDAAKLFSGITGSVAVIAVAGVQHAADG